MHESRERDFWEVYHCDVGVIEHSSDDMTDAERRMITAWFSALEMFQDYEMYAPHRDYDIPVDNYMVFNQLYSLTDETRMTVDVVKFTDDYWMLMVERYFWDAREEGWDSEIWPFRSYKCDGMRGLKAAIDATVGKLAAEYLRIERKFQEVRAMEKKNMEEVEEALKLIEKSK